MSYSELHPTDYRLEVLRGAEIVERVEALHDNCGGYSVTVHWKGGGQGSLRVDDRCVQGAADVEAMVQEVIDARWSEMEAVPR